MLIRSFQPSEMPDLSQILAEAFLDNPLNCAVIRQNARARLRVNRAGMDLTLDSACDEARVLTVQVRDGGLTGRGECVPYARYDETLESVTAEIAGLRQELLLRGALASIRFRDGPLLRPLRTRSPEGRRDARSKFHGALRTLLPSES